jgi:hypothetical protein
LKIASKTRHHRHTSDIREEKMPDLGMVSMLDAETELSRLINTSAKAVQNEL